MTGDLDAHIKYQSGEALGNSEGSASDMVGMGAGMAMGQQMAESMRKKSTPPELVATETQYFVAIDGNSEGPFPIETIHAYVQSGKITHKTRMWTEGMEAWDEASNVVSDVFAKTPPPLK